MASSGFRVTATGLVKVRVSFHPGPLAMRSSDSHPVAITILDNPRFRIELLLVSPKETFVLRRSLVDISSDRQRS